MPVVLAKLSASHAAGFSPKLLREQRQGQEIKTEAISLSTSLSGKVLHPLTSFYDMPQTRYGNL